MAIISFFFVFCRNPGYTENIPLKQFYMLLDKAIKQERNLDYFCFFCRNLWSSSTVHCMTCGKCVEGFDHHCSFVNNCVGFRNHGPFLTFLIVSAFYLFAQVNTILYTWVRKVNECNKPKIYDQLKMCNSHGYGIAISILCVFFLILAFFQSLPILWQII